MLHSYSLLFIFSTNNQVRGNEILELNNNPYLISNLKCENSNLHCRTITIGVNILIAYIETTLTICCHGFPPGPTFCFELGGREYNDATEYQIEYDVPEEWSESTNSIEIVRSSIADFNGHRIKIRAGEYLIVDNKIFLEYEVL